MMMPPVTISCTQFDRPTWLAAVGDDAHDERADQRAGGPCPGRRPRLAPPIRRGDDIQLQSDGGRGSPRSGRQLQHAAEPAKQAAQRVDQQLHPLDRHAAQTRGKLVRADGEHVAAEPRERSVSATSAANPSISHTPPGSGAPAAEQHQLVQPGLVG